MALPIDVWYELWEEAGARGLDTWHEPWKEDPSQNTDQPLPAACNDSRSSTESGYDGKGAYG